MAEVGSAYLSVLPSARGFGRNLDKEVSSDVDKSGKKAGSRFGAALGKGVAVGAAIGGVALIKFGSSIVGAASKAQQSLGGTEAVFGRFADTVVKNSDRAADKFGLSANEYRENANLIGSLFKNQGIASDQLAGKTDKMIGVASDLAATFGGTTSEAVETLGAAFKGEYDSIERYGISLKESEVSALLAKRGQDKLTGSAAKLAKQQAVTDLIMRQSKDSVGAFARESDTLAGKQQRLGAAFENLKARLGEKLLPVVTRIVGAFARFVQGVNDGTGAGGRFAAFMGRVGDVIQRIGGFIGGTVLPYLAQLRARFVQAAGGTQGFKKAMSDLGPVAAVVKVVLGALFRFILFALPVLIRYWRLLAAQIGFVSRVVMALYNKAFAPALRAIITGVGRLMQTWGRMLSLLGKVPGFGWAKRAGETMQEAGRKAVGLGQNIKNIPTKKDTKITANTAAANVSAANFNRTLDYVTRPRTVTISVRNGAAAFNAGASLLPGRAAGGPVNPGTTYIVGERGPEIFTTSQRGHIIPNHKIGASSVARSGGTSGPVTLVVGDREMNAWFEERYDAEGALP